MEHMNVFSEPVFSQGYSSKTLGETATVRVNVSGRRFPPRVRYGYPGALQIRSAPFSCRNTIFAAALIERHGRPQIKRHKFRGARLPDLSLRGGAADGAISGRHCRPVQAVEETYTPIASVAALSERLVEDH